MGFARILVCLLFYSSFTTISVAQQAFRCTEKTSCHSLVGYKSPNTTSISSIQKLFGVKNRHSLLGANNLPLSTPSNYVIREQQSNQGALWKRSRQCLGQPMTHCIGLTGLRITVNLLQKTAFDVPLK
ncbi:hypothetical protein OIU77_029179, partial [Salix suchowensis]